MISEINLQQQLNQFLQHATDQDRQALHEALTALEQRQDETYIKALLQANHTYDASTNEVTITLPILSFTKNRINIVHGGITALIMDEAMGTLAHHNVAENQTVVTTDMTTHYLKPGDGEKLTCIASMMQIGRKRLVAQATVYDDHGEKVAFSTASFFSITKR